MVGGTTDSVTLHDDYDDHPSLSASLEEFEHNGSPMLNIPSHHSGFYRSEDGESSVHSDTGSAFSPPGDRRAARAASMGWSTHRPYQQEPLSKSLLGSRLSLRRSRETGPQFGVSPDDETTLAANIRLPTDSPMKRSRNSSPEPFPEGEKDFGNRFGDGGGGGGGGGGRKEENSGPTDEPVARGNGNNSTALDIRFAVRAEVQHRTEPFEAAFAYVRRKFDEMTESKRSCALTFVVLLFTYLTLRLLLTPPPPPPAPDLVKVATLARAFEPLIFYSENGVQQIGDLQETGVAVWDLGESLRSTNMTSAPIIVKELDDLSESLKTLAIELTRFFANVDGDIDGILIVMEWARRELSQLPSKPAGPLTSAISNLHSAMCRVGLLESADGDPTVVGKVVTSVFGYTLPQRTRRTLQRTFNEFLAVLEESINTELTYSTTLFGLFESIDRHFLNLARTVIRETDQQEREEGELLSSLWTRVLGSNAAQLRKYEKNRLLLSRVRERTVRNKQLLVDHNGKLLTLKANLEILRKKLVSPLVRSNDSSTLSIEEQILGLGVTHDHLRDVRERQKSKLMEMLFGVGNRRVSLTHDGGGGGGDGYEIDGAKGHDVY
ncbi:MAG: hypothetical protein M1816_002814 [Peltula sp. TS41687]|nr:MAG: hypothetical protein M1816_002814 [Peltula sp. TS41687]